MTQKKDCKLPFVVIKIDKMLFQIYGNHYNNH